jgi:hypothetical protein
MTEVNSDKRGGVAMKCLDHIDMAAVAGAVATLASAVFLFAYLGVERGPLGPPEPMTSAMFLQQEMEKTINEAVVTPARVMDEQERTQTALGRAVVALEAAKERVAAFALDPETIPAPHALTQADMGRLIVAGSQALQAALLHAETRYGLAVRDALVADRRAAGEPAASRATMVAAAQVMADLAKRATPAPAPEITRDPRWGFGSIGDGIWLPIIVLASGVLLLGAAGAGMMTERGPSMRTIAEHCDVHDKDVLVEMLLSDDTPYEVVQCSAFNGGPVACDRRCLHRPIVPMAQAA